MSIELPEAGSQTEGSGAARVLMIQMFPPTNRFRRSLALAAPWRGWVFGIVLLVVIPSLVGAQGIGQANLVLLATIGAVALNLLQGIAGQLSVGNAAFMAVGAFTAGSLTHYFHHVPFLVVILAGCAIGTAIGLIVGIPALRVRGLYLLIATLAFQYVSSFAFERYQGNAAGPGGFPIPIASIGSWQIDTQYKWYVVWAVVACFAVWLMKNVTRTRLGRAWMAIREDERMASSSGVNVPRSVIAAFGISAALIGLQGALFAYYVGVVQYDTFSTTLAIQYLAMILIGGEGSITGPILGATVVEAVPWAINRYIPSTGQLAAHTADIQALIYGFLIIIVLIAEPRGLAGLGRRISRYINRRLVQPRRAA